MLYFLHTFRTPNGIANIIILFCAYCFAEITNKDRPAGKFLPIIIVILSYSEVIYQSNYVANSLHIVHYTKLPEPIQNVMLFQAHSQWYGILRDSN
jgi:hypothetical protein